VTEFGADAMPSIPAADVRPGQVILDVRTDEEWAAGHIDGAVHVPLDRLANRMSYEPGELLSDEPLVVTCKGGGRARQAATWLNNNGFEAVLLDGSMLAWERAGHPMVSETGHPPEVR
jgi:rhodanese-related sulfurtransferase